MLARIRGGFRVEATKSSGCLRHFDPVLAAALGLVEGPVGGFEELVHLPAGPMLRDAEAAGDADDATRPAEEGALAERRPHTLGELSAAGRVGARQQEQELLAAPAPRDVGLTNGRAEDAGELA